MKRQTRPFVVEVKNKRRVQSRKSSIWGDLDLSAVAHESNVSFVNDEPDSPPSIDSNSLSTNSHDRQNSQSEHHMPDPIERQSEQPALSTSDNVYEQPLKTSSIKKAATQRRKPVRGAPTRAESKSSDNGGSISKPARKVFSEKERIQKIDEIEKLTKGGANIKAAAKQAGVSVNT